MSGCLSMETEDMPGFLKTREANSRSGWKFYFRIGTRGHQKTRKKENT